MSWVVVAGGGSRPAPGTAVTTVCLTSAAAKYNNRRGVVTAARVSKDKPERIAVLLDGAAKAISFKLINLRLVLSTHVHEDTHADVHEDAHEGELRHVLNATSDEPFAESAIDGLPDEIMCLIFKLLDAKTLLINVPQVCRRWRGVCQQLKDVHLDFRWTTRDVPVSTLAGWRQDSDGGDEPIGCGNCYACVKGGSHPCQSTWVTGVCRLFPGATGISLGQEWGSDSHVEDDHLFSLVHDRFGQRTDLGYANIDSSHQKCPRRHRVGVIRHPLPCGGWQQRAQLSGVC